LMSFGRIRASPRLSSRAFLRREPFIPEKFVKLGVLYEI